ncbi:MAG: hypothetical protein HWE27_11595 [Gammaproteobacteria bacterium]|nr:hypothetical protein [Gammaproteobacteria bacterium]
MERIDLNKGVMQTIYLDAKKYLPANIESTDLPWSVALNVLCSFRLSQPVKNAVALFIEYQDSRGKHRIPVDFFEPENDISLLFSNLVQLPIRGSVDELNLKLVGLTEGVTVEPELVHLNLEESRSFVDSKSMRKVV